MSDLKPPDQPHRQAKPGRIAHHLLTRAVAERQEMEHRAVAADQARKYETAGWARYKHIAIESLAEAVGWQ